MLVAKAAIQMAITTIVILALVTRCCLLMVMQKTTQALSIVTAVRSQMVDIAETIEIKPYI